MNHVVLPDEVMLFVFSFLDIKALGRALLVSKAWSFIASHSSLWKGFCEGTGEWVTPPLSKTKAKTKANAWKLVLQTLPDHFDLSGNCISRAPNIAPIFAQKKHVQGIKLLVLGRSGVGKTALTIRFVQNIFVPVCQPTIEDSYRVAVNLGNEYCFLEIVDTTGNEGYREMRELNFKTMEGCMFVFDTGSRESLEGIFPFLQHLIQYTNKSAHELCAILVGTKAGEGRMTRREVTYEEAVEKAKAWKMKSYIEVSALTGYHVDLAFLSLARRVKHARPSLSSPPSSFCASRSCFLQ